MKALLLAMLLLPHVATAAAEEAEGPYAFKGKVVDVKTHAAEELTVSQNCREKSGAFTCAATKNLAKLSLKAVRADHPGTEAAGSFLCEEQLKGKVVIALSPIGDERTFCRFDKDDTLIDLGSLVFRALKNDEGAASAAPSPSSK